MGWKMGGCGQGSEVDARCGRAGGGCGQGGRDGRWEMGGCGRAGGGGGQGGREMVKGER